MAKECLVMLYHSLMEWAWLPAIGLMFQRKFERHYPTLERLHPTLRFPPDMRRSTRALVNMGSIRMRLVSTNLPESSSDAWAGRPKWALLDLLSRAWSFEATDPRDKVYSVIGLLDFSAHCQLTAIRPPDYSPDTEFDPLVLSVFLESLTTNGGLECLSCCTSTIKDTTPSWMSAVDIGFITPHELTLHNLCDAGGMAAGWCRSHIRCVSSDPLLVSFRVTHLGAMRRVLGPFPGEAALEEVMRHIRHPRAYFQTHIEMAVSQLADYWNACETLAAETTMSSAPTAPGEEEEATDLFRWAFLCDVDPSYHDPVDVTGFRRNPHPPPAYDVREIAQKRPVLFGLMGRLRFGVADAASSRRARPLLCWIPASTREGDRICVVHGYRFPMVIRRVPGPDEHYRFLGVSYVQGYMDGEALDDGHYGGS